MAIHLKKLSESDWKLFREIRLRALKEDPQAFGSNYKKENKYTEELWRNRLSGESCAVFGVFDGKKLIGMTGVKVDQNDDLERKGYFWGSWLEPSYRKKGISKLMYAERLKWAKDHPTLNVIRASYWVSNKASEKAMIGSGFKPIYRKKKKRSSDGKILEEVFCEIALSSFSEMN